MIPQNSQTKCNTLQVMAIPGNFSQTKEKTKKTAEI